MRSLRMNSAFRTDLLESGFGTTFDSGTLEIRSGAQPASANDSPSGTVLASITLPATAFNAAVSGSKPGNTPWSDADADASGTAGWFRIRNAGDTRRIDGSCGIADDIKLSGAVTEATVNTATDQTQAMTVNQHVGRHLKIVGGTGAGQELEIVGNTATVFTLEKDWTTTPDGTSTYQVVEHYDMEFTTVSVILNDEVTIDSYSIDLEPLA